MKFDWVKDLIDIWNHIPEHINPVFLSLGPFQIRYYGLMWVLSILVVYLLVLYRRKKEGFDYSERLINDFFLWVIIGILIGGRLGYVAFYNWQYYLSNPLEIFLPVSLYGGFHFTGISGLSYHGGLIGGIASILLFCRKYKIRFLKFVDFIIPAVPLGYTFGRIGNFLNGELYGRTTNLPWGMYFPEDLTHQLRHPSQLYEAFFEGILLFLLLWSLRKKKMFDGFLFATYLIGYGLVRFLIEFVREPDSQLGLVLGMLTMGQILSLGMVIIGLIFMIGFKFRFEGQAG